MNSFGFSASALQLGVELFTESALVTGDALNVDDGLPAANFAIDWDGNAGINLRNLLDDMGGSTARGGKYKVIIDAEITLFNTFLNVRARANTCGKALLETGYARNYAASPQPKEK